MSDPNTQEAVNAIHRLMSEGEALAYQRGWNDALTKIRKGALDLRYMGPDGMIWVTDKNGNPTRIVGNDHN